MSVQGYDPKRRYFNPDWEVPYLFQVHGGEAQCIVCRRHIISKLFNIKRHYENFHLATYRHLQGLPRRMLYDTLKEIAMNDNKKIANNTPRPSADENDSTAQGTEELPTTSYNVKYKRMRYDEEDEDMLLNKAVSLMSRPTDDFQVFGDYVASEFRTLKSESNRLLLRRKIQKIIVDVAEMDAADDENSQWDSATCATTSKEVYFN